MRKFITVLNVSVALSLSANSPYLSKVYEFKPAPGQFVNEMPEYEEGDNEASMILKVEEQLCGDKNPGMISLGAWGGYVVFGFDHPVVNVKDQYDFKIYGNAFAATGSTTGGSSEPGIVMVSYDENENGIPDDKWYELAGSEYGKATTIQNYKLTYYKPPVDHVATPHETEKHISDAKYIKWVDNNGATGYVMKNVFNRQSYWPEWETDDTMVFEGVRLPDNGTDLSTNGTNYFLSFFEYGYVDNKPNVDDLGFKIDWAVDEKGNKANLPAIHFIKVYNSVNQYCGWLGETSTEIQGGEDLHPEAVTSGIEDVMIEENVPVEYYNLQGVKVGNPQKGIFIIRKGSKTYKMAL